MVWLNVRISVREQDACQYNDVSIKFSSPISMHVSDSDFSHFLLFLL